jgi:hypothetical protein
LPLLIHQRSTIKQQPKMQFRSILSVSLALLTSTQAAPVIPTVTATSVTSPSSTPSTASHSFVVVPLTQGSVENKVFSTLQRPAPTVAYMKASPTLVTVPVSQENDQVFSTLQRPAPTVAYIKASPAADNDHKDVVINSHLLNNAKSMFSTLRPVPTASSEQSGPSTPALGLSARSDSIPFITYEGETISCGDYAALISLSGHARKDCDVQLAGLYRYDLRDWVAAVMESECYTGDLDQWDANDCQGKVRAMNRVERNAWLVGGITTACPTNKHWKQHDRENYHLHGEQNKFCADVQSKMNYIAYGVTT